MRKKIIIKKNAGADMVEKIKCAKNQIYYHISDTIRLDV